MAVLAQRQSVSALRLVRPWFVATTLGLISYCTGSNVIVAGSAIFGAPSPEDVIAQLKASVAAAQVKRTEVL